MRLCNIAGCENIAMAIVDDHGVDTYLCGDHYCEWKAVEKNLNYELQKWMNLHEPKVR